MPSGKIVTAGELVVGEPNVNGALEGQFRYDPEYLANRKKAFPLDPLHLDLSLKNFCMLHDDDGWKLCPAFDLVPNIGFNREHVLRIGYDNRPPNLKTLLQEAGHFGLKRQQQAAEVIRDVHEVVFGWSAVFTACNVPERDAESIGKDISQRLKITGGFLL